VFVCDFAWLSDYDGKEKNNYGPSLCPAALVGAGRRHNI